jgi:hypothetical protein
LAVPAGSLVNAVEPSQGTCTRTASMVFCEMGSIGARQIATVAMTAPPTPMTLSLTATQGVSTDATSGGNSAVAMVTVVPVSRRRPGR